ncbi:hypothetical protein K2P96_01795 [Patescibacteria group bacterium]|nr:hypothetical protein [Patescibacteria group bacterium]
MAKAKLTLPNGTDIQIEGTPEEVKGLLSFYLQSGPVKGKNPIATAPTKQGKKRKGSIKSGPASLIRELIEEDYFKAQKRSLSDIQKKLEERGHIYAQTSLSMPLTRLTRSKELRRLQEKKGWMYVV